MPWGGHPQGVPLPIVLSRRYALGRAPTRGALLPIVFSRRYALGRAPTRGAPTDCLLSAVCPGEGTHKGCPYRLSSLGGMPWGGHPQGVPFYRLSSLGGMPWEGHPQGAPLPIVFSRRYALGRAPTRGATDCRLSAVCPGKGTHKGCPYRLSSLGGMPWGGHPQGVPLPIVVSRRYALGRAPTRGALLPIVFSRRYALGRAPTRGAPTDCLLSALCPGEGTHKGCPYLGVMPWGGHPQGVPLPRRYALGRAPTRGAPTSALCPGEGTHKGCPYLGVMPWGGHPQGVPLPRRYALGRAPTRGAPTDCLLSAFRPGKGTHKGCPYLGGMPWEGHPQGAPLPIVFSRRYALGRAPTRGAPTDCLLSAVCPLGRAPTRGAPTSAVCPGKGTHKGCPYRLSSLGGMPWEGHPQGVLPIVFSRRYALGRAPTRGATDCLLSAVCPGKGTHKGRPYRLSSLGGMPWEGHPQGAPLPIVFSRRYALGRAPARGAPTDCLLSALFPEKGAHKGCPYPIQAASRGFVPI